MSSDYMAPAVELSDLRPCQEGGMINVVCRYKEMTPPSHSFEDLGDASVSAAPTVIKGEQ